MLGGANLQCIITNRERDFNLMFANAKADAVFTVLVGYLRLVLLPNWRTKLSSVLSFVNERSMLFGLGVFV